MPAQQLTNDDGKFPADRPSPRPLSSLIASAQRLTSKTMPQGARATKAKPWQEDSWEMYDLVGEHRFIATTLAARMSQARLFVGRLSDDPTEPPEPVDDPALTRVLSSVGSGSKLAQIVNRLGTNLFVPGDSWLVGVPTWLLPASMQPPTGMGVGEAASDSFEPEPGTTSIDDLEWHAMSVSEVVLTTPSEVLLRFGETPAEQVMCAPDDIYLIRVWRPHPRRWWEADSPTRSSLPVLRELVGLTMHVSAQVDSRLAGAGLMIVPQSAQRALNIAAGLDADADTDQFTEALLEAMLTPIQDRSNASALVPLVVTVPDDVTDKFQFMTFSKPLDSEARNLRDEAIRRLALGLDAPPELLLGTGGMNHWGAWLVREDVVTTHIEPPLALICDAFTTQFLWPVLMDQGMSAEEVRRYVVWYDVSHMIMRPNRAQEALDLHSRGAIDSEALRNATGFSEADALMPPGLPLATTLALEMGARNPALYASPGIGLVAAQIEALLAGMPQPALPVAPDAETATAPLESPGDSASDGGGGDVALPATSDDGAEPPSLEASARQLTIAGMPTALEWRDIEGRTTLTRAR